jgi:hypothetical protein
MALAIQRTPRRARVDSAETEPAASGTGSGSDAGAGIGMDEDIRAIHEKLDELEERLITLRQGQHHQVVILVVVVSILFVALSSIIN